MTFPACPKCNSENTYHDAIQFVCPDCAYEWTGEEVAEDDEGQLSACLIDIDDKTGKAKSIQPIRITPDAPFFE